MPVDESLKENSAQRMQIFDTPIVVYSKAAVDKLKLPSTVAQAVKHIPLNSQNLESITGYKQVFQDALENLNGVDFFNFLIAGYQFLDLTAQKLPPHVVDVLINKVLDINGE
jgi:hypothetical protein